MKEFKSKHRVSHVIHIRASVSSMGKIIRNRACMRLLRGSLLFRPCYNQNGRHKDKEDVSVITGAVLVDFTWWLEATKGALVSQAQPAKPNYTQQTQADD